MGLTAQGKTVLIKSFLSNIKTCTFHCSGDIDVSDCLLICQPVQEAQTVKIIVAADTERCKLAGVKDGKTKFKSYTLYNNQKIAMYTGDLSGMTKPANAGLLVTINLSLGAI